MSKTAQFVLDIAWGALNDTGGTRWPLAELIGNINAGQLLIADIFPASSSVTEPTQLVPGATQAIPTPGLSFLGLTNNLGSDGTTQGNAITITDVEMMDSFRPGWRAEAGVTAIQNYMFDERYQKAFLVYPPVHGSTAVYVGLRYSKTPTDCTTGASTLGIDDKYAVALVEWVLFMAKAKDTDAADPVGANGHLGNFFNLLGLKDDARIKYSPNVQKRSGIIPRVAER